MFQLHGEVHVRFDTGAGKNRREHNKTVEFFPDMLLAVHGNAKGEAGHRQQPDHAPVG